MVVAVTALRVVAALSLFYSPLWGFVVVILFDILDAYVLIHRVGFTRNEYHRWDKIVDWASQIVMVIIGSLRGYAAVMFLLALFRLLGNFSFAKTGSTKYFILFPNFIEVAFLWWVALPTLPQWPLIASTLGASGLVNLFIIKELHEIALHMGSPIALGYLRKHGYPGWVRKFGIHNLK